MNTYLLKKHIKRTLRGKGLSVTSDSGHIGIDKRDKNNPDIKEVILGAIRQFCELEVKKEILNNVNTKSGIVLKFYANRIRTELPSGPKFVAAFKGDNFTLKSEGLWAMEVTLSENRWTDTKAVKFEVVVGVPVSGKIVISKIPDTAVDFLIGRQKSVSETAEVANSVDNFLLQNGFVGEDEKGIKASADLKGIFG